MIQSAIPLLGFCAWGSGMGKTTLLTNLIPVLTDRGIRVSVIKHAHHKFDIDHPGKDSYRLRESGAVQTLLGSSKRWALMTERSRTGQADQEIHLEELLAQLDTTLADIILVEGFKQEAIPKIEVHRPSLGMPLLAASDSQIIAIATDDNVPSPLPQLNLNDIQAIADFVIAWVEHQKLSINTATTH